MSNKALGLDIGGTKIEAAVVDHDGSVLCRQRIPTDRDKGYDDVMNRLAALINNLLGQNNILLTELKGIGAGLPGSVDPKSEMMINGNSQIFIEKDFCADLKKHLGFEGPVHAQNDANCFALAETLWGAGKELGIPSKEVKGFGIILGTGCGGGFVMDAKAYTGAHGGGSEIGHTTLGRENLKCYCGRTDCAELYLSGTGIQSAYKRKTGKEKSGKEIFQEDSDTAKEIIENYQNLLALLISHIANTFDPHLIVLGGGVSLQDKIYEGLDKKVKELLFLKDFPPLIKKHSLGDSAGVIGAASLVL